MMNIILPCQNEQMIDAMQKRLNEEFNMYVPTGKVLATDGTTIHFVRLSCQIYLEISDFQRFGDIVLQLLSECA